MTSDTILTMKQARRLFANRSSTTVSSTAHLLVLDGEGNISPKETIYVTKVRQRNPPGDSFRRWARSIFPTVRISPKLAKVVGHGTSITND